MDDADDQANPKFVRSYVNTKYVLSQHPANRGSALGLAGANAENVVVGNY